VRILFVSQYFPPEMGAPSARVSELARRWVDAGEEVTVLTAFPHHPVGRKAPGDRWRLTRRETFHGVDVLRAYIWAAPNRGVVRRMLSYLSFLLSALAVGLIRGGRTDIVVATSPQLLAACAGYALARFHRVPFVFEVRDLWPESILAVGAMQENPLVRGLKRMSRHLYEHSDQIVTAGEGYREQIHHLYGVPRERMITLPNGIDPQLFRPAPASTEVRRELGAGDGQFLVVYLGTLGMAHGLDTLLEVAERLRHRHEIAFALVGEGAEKDRLMRLAADRRLTNVRFVGQQPRERMPALYAAADLGLVLLRDRPLFQSVLPSKIFEWLAMARPIVVTVAGEARRIIESSGGGVFVPPESPAALAEEICRLAAGGVDLVAMGEAGRAHVVAHYNRDLQAETYRLLLRRLVAESRGNR
jgi:colanic acid biosynthesis glycosyl transferase WcaI